MRRTVASTCSICSGVAWLCMTTSMGASRRGGGGKGLRPG
jgi:hypothetical protein